MTRAIFVLAFLGAVLVLVVTQLFMPNTSTGLAVVFVAFGIAMYPLARVLWFASMPAWRYWLGLTVGTVVGWIVDTWRRESISDATNQLLAMIVVAGITLAFIAGIGLSYRKRHQP
jgi:hypothetical protein